MTAIPLHDVKVNHFGFCHTGFYDSEEGIVLPLIQLWYRVSTYRFGEFFIRTIVKVTESSLKLCLLAIILH